MKLIYIALVLLAFIAFMAPVSSAATLMGGWTKQDPQNEEFRQLWADKVQGLFLQQLNDPHVNEINTRPFIVGISTQVVAGLNINYTVKYNNKTFEVKAYRNLSNEVTITSVTASK